MSQKRKNQRAAHQAKQEQSGKNVVTWIFGGLVVLALCYMVYTFIMLS